MRRVGVWIVVMSTWLGACSGSEETHPQATADPTVGFSLATHGLVGATDAEGRQCLDSGDQLSDGIWFGMVKGIDPGSVLVDIACYWSGEGAAAKAVSDGHEPVLFYLINEDPQTYTVELDAFGTAHWVDGESSPEPIPMAAWPVAGSTFDQRCPHETCGVWLFINGGAVTELVEWYLPRWEAWNPTLPLGPWGPPSDISSGVSAAPAGELVTRSVADLEQLPGVVPCVPPTDQDISIGMGSILRSGIFLEAAPYPEAETALRAFLDAGSPAGQQQLAQSGYDMLSLRGMTDLVIYGRDFGDGYVTLVGVHHEPAGWVVRWWAASGC